MLILMLLSRSERLLQFTARLKQVCSPFLCENIKHMFSQHIVIKQYSHPNSCLR